MYERYALMCGVLGGFRAKSVHRARVHFFLYLRRYVQNTDIVPKAGQNPCTVHTFIFLGQLRAVVQTNLRSCTEPTPACHRKTISVYEHRVVTVRDQCT